MSNIHTKDLYVSQGLEFLSVERKGDMGVELKELLQTVEALVDQYGDNADISFRAQPGNVDWYITTSTED